MATASDSARSVSTFQLTGGSKHAIQARAQHAQIQQSFNTPKKRVEPTEREKQTDKKETQIIPINKATANTFPNIRKRCRMNERQNLTECNIESLNE